MQVSHGSHHSVGFFSCCSVALYRIIEHFNRHGDFPEVDFSRTFRSCKDEAGDVYDRFFKFDGSIEPPHRHGDFVHFPERSLFRYADEDYHADIKPFLDRWFRPSDEVLETKARLLEKYGIEPKTTTAVCFRGTDKCTEVEEPSFESFRRAMVEHGKRRFFVQTDQAQFLDFALGLYPCVFLDELPRTHARGKDTAIHFSKKTNRTAWAVNFLASVLIMADCSFVISHTGNVARWITIYRGTTKGTIQFRGRERIND